MILVLNETQTRDPSAWNEIGLLYPYSPVSLFSASAGTILNVPWRGEMTSRSGWAAASDYPAFSLQPDRIRACQHVRIIQTSSGNVAPLVDRMTRDCR